MTLPNLITIARFFMVPLIVWLMIAGYFTQAFWLFLLAGLSDAADGILARRLNMKSDLGAHLDPAADKALLVSIYVTLGFMLQIPAFIVIAVVSRDILIVGAVVLSWMLERPVPMRPLLVSKANTFVQILFAGLVLADLALSIGLDQQRMVLGYAVGFLTVSSAAAYMIDWIGHMAKSE